MENQSIEALKTKLQSARKSILFMETQHANTLKGLHAEIQQLQKKCSELTFDAAMHTDFAATDESSPKAIQQLQSEVTLLTREKISMVQLLEEKDRQFVELETHAIAQEKKYLNELKVKSHKISALANEMDTRSDTIGYLSAQLHQAKSKLHSLQQHQQVKRPSKSPAPPSIPRSKGPHRSLRSADGSQRPASSSTCGTASRRSLNSRPSSAMSVKDSSYPVPATKSSSNLNTCFSPSPMPDPTPFLHAGESVATTIAPKPPSILPPIHRRSAVSPAQDANGNRLFQSSAALQKYPSRDKSTKRERFRDAEKIAVRRVNTTISPERKLHEGSVRPL